MHKPALQGALLPLIAVLVALGAFACQGGAASGAAAPARPPQSEQHTLLGAPAPEFSLPAFSPQGSATVALADSAGRVRVIDFWATWCGPCKLSLPQYQQMQERFGDRVVFLALSQDDDAADIGPFAQAEGIDFALLWDEGKAVSARFGVEAMPTLFVVDANGLVRYVHTGFHEGDEQQIEAAIQSVLE